MKIKTLVTILVPFLFSSCMTLKDKNIIYNQEKGLYEYHINKTKKITLRNEDQCLVDTVNYNVFKDELVKNRKHYPIKKRVENDILLKHKDMELSKQYAKINKAIVDNEFKKSIEYLNTISLVYSDINKYSDCYFLKGYAFKKMGLLDSATTYFKKFLATSSQKYSGRFRGYRDADLNDSILINERNYSKNHLLDNNYDAQFNFSVIEPKYYYGSFQPGYSINKEDFASTSYGLLMFLVGKDFANELSFGAQYYYRMNDIISFNPRFSYSRNMKEFSLGVPIQVYKSSSNNLGLKFTPFVNYLSLDSVKVDNKKYLFNKDIFNFGGRISVGYYPVQKISIGAYYQYNFYNEMNKIRNDNSQFEFWIENEYDLSLYYNIYKGISFKTGIKNKDFVVGMFLSGWEISYNVSSPGLILKVDMY